MNTTVGLIKILIEILKTFLNINSPTLTLVYFICKYTRLKIQ